MQFLLENCSAGLSVGKKMSCSAEISKVQQLEDSSCVLAHLPGWWLVVVSSEFQLYVVQC